MKEGENAKRIARRMGQNIKTVRLRKKISKAQLAKAAKTSTSYVSRLEGQQITNPRIGHIFRISLSLGMSIDELWL